jgi:hypothetical protein
MRPAIQQPSLHSSHDHLTRNSLHHVFFAQPTPSLIPVSSIIHSDTTALPSHQSQNPSWVALLEKVSRQCAIRDRRTRHANTTFLSIGGKAKPLKAPKKEKKELDEDDLAHKEKLKAGTGHSDHLGSVTVYIAF